MPAKPVSDAFCTLETPVGTLAAAWGPGGLTRLRLPEATVEDLVAALAQDLGDLDEGKPPRGVARDLTRIRRHLEGTPQDLAAIRLDFTGVSPFHLAVYQAARRLGPGEQVSYGELAALAGSPRAARAVGQAMARNRFPIVVPCHRVVGANGKPGGFTAHGWLETKARLLAVEGVELGRRAPATALGFDLEEAVEDLAARDPTLGRWMARVGPCRLEVRGAQAPYDQLARAIVYQQLSGKAAGTIYGRLLDLFPRRRLGRPAALLEVPPERLRGAGLSRAKVAAVRDLAARTADGTVPGLAAARRMTDDELIERLVQVRGIGRWSVEMFLMFGLGRPDVLAVDDLGLRKGLARVMRRKALPSPKQLLARGERWRPFRSVASWYLWRITEL